MVKTVDVFTPAKHPTYTSVTRTEIWRELEDLAEQGGAIISVLGTTKLGKSTLVRETMAKALFYAYVPGQNLTGGASALWAALVAKLGIPSSSTTGKVSGDKSKWSFFARFGVSIPTALNIGGGSTVAGEHHVDSSTGATYDMDAPTAVTEALAILSAAARESDKFPPMIVIDDFHFVTNSETRRELVLALRPITESNATLVLATLPGRENDEAFSTTNAGGRHYSVKVPVWNDDELRQIADRGFEILNVRATDETKNQLIKQSYGSPQIMQQLCLNLCRRVNGVRDDTTDVGMLSEPESWPEFFRLVRDEQSVAWLRTLGVGLTARRGRNLLDLKDGSSLDGYQLILRAIHEMRSPAEVPFTAVRDMVGELVAATADLSTVALEQKAKNMGIVASRQMQAALDKKNAAGAEDQSEQELEEQQFTEEEIQIADLIPQPVFEVAGNKAATMQIRILDPLLAYSLTWHPEAFEQR
ncbi:hypothetical protein C5D04_13640 [Rathayibacter sp. AY1D2]|uniref:hypothetical protein n=1 Tax=unclassified Rathayibacter TaxID=2609250 RepID=UPI000CE731EB|nr:MULTISPECIES: hypothetical protein [unclassified Rathayibacter]PPF32055.1 hypothetical protein C5B93_16305 [Rathayibacter sp. AY1A2]PPI10854.1 hypothetical protein C5D04_13640 [Rathayibacter sp. AY1D2]